MTMVLRWLTGFGRFWYGMSLRRTGRGGVA